MTRIAFATYQAQPGVTDDDRLLVDALGRHDIAVDAFPWDADAAWAGYDAVLPRSTWDFHRRLPEFERWIERLTTAGVRLINAPALLRWNSTKRYLQSLGDHGIDVVPTAWIERRPAHGVSSSLREVIEHREWRDGVVVKPTVSASAHDTWVTGDSLGDDDEARFSESLARAPHGLMVQPFLPHIQAHGEWSLVFLRGQYSHAVLKRPAAGDFRVQHEHGGSAISATPAPRLVADAARALAVAASATEQQLDDVLYARVDGIEHDGRLLLMELECIEPALFFATAPESAERMADGIDAIAGRRLSTGKRDWALGTGH